MQEILTDYADLHAEDIRRALLYDAYFVRAQVVPV